MRYHDGLLDGFLDLHTLSSDGLVQFPLKGQEIHVGLGLWDQVSDLKSRQQGVNIKGIQPTVNKLNPVTFVSVGVQTFLPSVGEPCRPSFVSLA